MFACMSRQHIGRFSLCFGLIEDEPTKLAWVNFKFAYAQFMNQ